MSTLITYALCTVGDVKAYMGQDDATSRDEALITECINGVTNEFETYCDRKFLSRQYVHDGTTLPLLPGNGTDKLILPQRPVTAITTLIPWPSGPSLTRGWLGQYMLDQQAGIITLATATYLRQSYRARTRRSSLVFPEGDEIVAVTYTAGFLTNATAGSSDSTTYGYAERAGDLRFAAIKQAAEFVHRRSRSREGVVSKTLPTGESYSFIKTEMLPEVKAVLDRYAGVFIG